MPFDLSDPHVPDEALLSLYATGDRAASAQLTLRLAPRVFAHATRMLGDRAEAEDVTQEAMLRLWRMAPDWREGEASVGTWLYRVASNLCLDRLRRRGRSGPLDQAGDPPDPAPGAVAALQARDRSLALSAALARLPDRQRQAVVLRHLDGLANPEIARVMDLTVEAVESLTARARRALAADLGSRRDELGYGDG